MVVAVGRPAAQAVSSAAEISAGTLVLTQLPVAGSHESPVHTLPSLQLTGGKAHCPVVGSQVSWVQGLLSLQVDATPWQMTAPAWDWAQASPEVQRLPSSQEAPAGRGVPM